MRLAGALRILKYRNYRLYFIGQGLSVTGTLMQGVALGWLVYRLTHSALLLGVVGFFSQIAGLIIGPFAGVLVDRWNLRRLLVATQALAMVQATVLAALVLSGHIAVWQIIGLSVFLGLVNAFDVPSRQSFVIEMVEHKEDLGTAIALNSSMFNIARLMGPSLAGILVAAVGEGFCFVINAISYLAVIAALLAMRLRPQDKAPKQTKIWQELREGMAYVVKSPPVRALLLLMGATSLLGTSYGVLLPVFSAKMPFPPHDLLNGGARTMGFLTSAVGVGALVGALYLAGRRSPVGLGRRITLACGLLGAALIAFGLSHWLALSLAVLAFAGLGMAVMMAGTNTILQTVVDDDKRGRIMSWYFMSFAGFAPFGSLLTGTIAHAISAPYAVVISGSFCLLAAGIFALYLPTMRQSMRPIYQQMGLIPKE